MKDNIIITGLFHSGGGLTNVMQHLISHLGISFGVTCIGFDPKRKDGAVVSGEIQGCDSYIFPLNGNLFKIGSDTLESYINLCNPICVITLGPILFHRYLLLLLQKYRPGVKIISYIPVEGQLVDANFLKYVDLLDFHVFYTVSVYNDFKKLLLENDRPDTLPASFIGHGIDKKSFYPVRAANDKERRKISRRIVYRDAAVNEDSFVVLNMNRFYYRKKIDVTVEGFKQFALNKENVYLHLHLGSAGDNEIQMCYDLVEKSGIKDRVIITPGSDDPDLKSVDWLNTLYNACDVGISTSMGEGWGLGLFEHAATRAAILAPGHTGFLENWENAAILIPWSEKEFIFYEYSDMFIVSPDAVCTSLNALYSDKDLLDKVSQDCFNRALESKYDWANIAAQFKQVISGLQEI